MNGYGRPPLVVRQLAKFGYKQCILAPEGQLAPLSLITFAYGAGVSGVMRGYIHSNNRKQTFKAPPVASLRGQAGA